MEPKDRKELVLDIITESFKKNPGVLSVIKKDNNLLKRVRGLANYAYETAIQRDGILLSEDKTGVLISYRNQFKKPGLKDYYQQLLLVLNVTGISSIKKLLKREAYMKSIRPQDEDFIYVWFYGVIEEGKGRGAAKELKNILFDKAIKENLSIYLETTERINRLVYERYGFEVYHTWEKPNENITIWFMRKSF